MSTATKTIDPEPPKAGPDGFLSKEWKDWEYRAALQRQAERDRLDPAQQARRKTEAEQQRLDAAEAAVIEAEEAFDAVKVRAMAKEGGTISASGAAAQIGVMISRESSSSDDWLEAEAVLQNAIRRRAVVRFEVSAQQSARYEAANEARGKK